MHHVNRFREQLLSRYKLLLLQASCIPETVVRYYVWSEVRRTYRDNQEWIDERHSWRHLLEAERQVHYLAEALRGKSDVVQALCFSAFGRTGKRRRDVLRAMLLEETTPADPYIPSVPKTRPPSYPKGILDLMKAQKLSTKPAPALHNAAVIGKKFPDTRRANSEWKTFENAMRKLKLPLSPSLLAQARAGAFGQMLSVSVNLSPFRTQLVASTLFPQTDWSSRRRWARSLRAVLLETCQVERDSDRSWQYKEASAGPNINTVPGNFLEELEALVPGYQSKSFRALANYELRATVCSVLDDCGSVLVCLDNPANASRGFDRDIAMRNHLETSQTNSAILIDLLTSGSKCEGNRLWVRNITSLQNQALFGVFFVDMPTKERNRAVNQAISKAHWLYSLSRYRCFQTNRRRLARAIGQNLAHGREYSTNARSLPSEDLQMYVSKSNNPYFNLALENKLFKERPDGQNIVFLYRNSPCVVIGRNQNPWKEANLGLLEQKAIPVVRRFSGGGAVFHDMGNTNYCAITTRENFDRDRHGQAIAKRLQSYGINVKVNARHDLVYGMEELKVSGSAFKITKIGAYHHGTMLLNSDLENIGVYLRSPLRDIISGGGVDSLSSKVSNIGISHENFCGLVAESMESLYRFSKDRIIQVDQDSTLGRAPGLLEDMNQLQSWDWNFGSTPPFQFSLQVTGRGSHRAHLVMRVRRGRIEDVSIQSSSPTNDNSHCSVDSFASSLVGLELTRDALLSQRTADGDWQKRILEPIALELPHRNQLNVG